MVSLKSIDLRIAEKLKKKPYRDVFFQSWTQDEVAIQIKSLRKKRKLLQRDLGVATGMKQSAVSRLEQAEYSRWSFQTLLRLAKALDARIRIVLEPAEDVIRQYEQQENQVADLTLNEARELASQRSYQRLESRRTFVPLGGTRERKSSNLPTVAVLPSPRTATKNEIDFNRI